MKPGLRSLVLLVLLSAVPFALAWYAAPDGDGASAIAVPAGATGPGATSVAPARARIGLGEHASAIRLFRWLTDPTQAPAVACDDDDDDGDDDADSLASSRAPTFDPEHAPDLRFLPVHVACPVAASSARRVELALAIGASSGHAQSNERPPRG